MEERYRCECPGCSGHYVEIREELDYEAGGFRGTCREVDYVCTECGCRPTERCKDAHPGN